jgi:hypothetical protein
MQANAIQVISEDPSCCSCTELTHDQSGYDRGPKESSNNYRASRMSQDSGGTAALL